MQTILLSFIHIPQYGNAEVHCIFRQISRVIFFFFLIRESRAGTQVHTSKVVGVVLSITIRVLFGRLGTTASGKAVEIWRPHFHATARTPFFGQSPSSQLLSSPSKIQIGLLSTQPTHGPMTQLSLLVISCNCFFLHSPTFAHLKHSHTMEQLSHLQGFCKMNTIHNATYLTLWLKDITFCHLLLLPLLYTAVSPA